MSLVGTGLLPLHVRVPPMELPSISVAASSTGIPLGRVTLVRHVLPTAAVRAPVSGPLMVVVQAPGSGVSAATAAAAGIAAMVATARAPASSDVEIRC